MEPTTIATTAKQTATITTIGTAATTEKPMKDINVC